MTKKNTNTKSSVMKGVPPLSPKEKDTVKANLKAAKEAKKEKAAEPAPDLEAAVAELQTEMEALDAKAKEEIDTGVKELEKPKAKKDRKPRPAKDGQPKEGARSEAEVTLKALCSELGVEPKIARRKLRGAIKAEKITRPSGRWGWEPNDESLATIREILKSAK